MRAAILLVAVACAACAPVREKRAPGPAVAPGAAFVKVADPEAFGTLDAPVLVGGDGAGYAEAEPVVGVVTPSGEARAYSMWQLERTPVVNDVADGAPLAVVFDPVSRAAGVFLRPTVAGTFGVSGLLHGGAMVVHDRATATMYGAISGEVLGGEGRAALVEYPSVVLPYAWWRALRPHTKALERGALTGPLVDPTSVAGTDAPGGVSAAALVLGVRGGEAARAYVLETTREIVNDEVGGLPVAIVPVGGSALALVRVGPVGSLTLEQRADRLVDRETGSGWTFDGRAFDGPLAGTALAPPPLARVVRWGAWRQAFPGTTLAR